MVLSRGNRPSDDATSSSFDSLTEIGQSLRVARQLAGASLTEAAADCGIDSALLDALESGQGDLVPDRIGTLRALRTYADSLGLPGDEVVLGAVASWPHGDVASPRPGDDGAPAVVSVTAAPAGGHSLAGSPADAWIGHSTGVTDSTITGVYTALGGYGDDTGRVPVFETGQVPAVRVAAPLALKVMVAVVALLVALGGVALAEHSHVNAWYHRTGNSVSHWFGDVKVALEIDPRTPARPPRATPPPRPKVTYVQSPDGKSVVISVGAKNFSVKMVAFGYAVWMKVTPIFHPQPIYDAVLPAGKSHTFGVISSMSIVTASASARAYIYEGTQFIGFYFPSRAPFTMTFNATK